MSGQASKKVSDINVSLQADIECWLEEHRALTSEIRLQLTSMHHMVILNITALGTITSLVLSNVGELGFLLLIIPILSSIIGIIAYFHSRRMSQIGHYIEQEITPKLVNLTGDSKVMGWESYIRGEEHKRNKFARWFSMSGAMLLTFILPNILALIFASFVPQKGLVAGTAWCVLWVVGLVLTIILVSLFIVERKFWFGKENS